MGEPKQELSVCAFHDVDDRLASYHLTGTSLRIPHLKYMHAHRISSPLSIVRTQVITTEMQLLIRNRGCTLPQGGWTTSCPARTHAPRTNVLVSEVIKGTYPALAVAMISPPEKKSLQTRLTILP